MNDYRQCLNELKSLIRNDVRRRQGQWLACLRWRPHSLRSEEDEEEVKVRLVRRKIPISTLWQTLSKRVQLHDRSDAQLSQVVE